MSKTTPYHDIKDHKADHDKMSSLGLMTKTLNITGSRNSIAEDDGNFLVNATSSNYTYTLTSGMGANFGVALIQQSTGTLTITAGAGVTFVGATLATASAGDIISVIWLSADTYLIKVG